MSDMDIRLERFSRNAKELKRCSPYPVAWLDLKTVNAIDIDYVDCNCWRCKHCGPRKKERWYNKLVHRLGKEDYIEYHFVKCSGWRTWRKALERLDKEAKYCKMKQIDKDSYLVITNAAAGGEEVPRVFRNEFLIQALIEVPFTSRPITTSRNWNEKKIKLKGEKSEEERQRERIDSCFNYPPEKMKEVIDEKFGPKGVITTLENPPGWNGGLTRIRITVPDSFLKPPGMFRTWDSMHEILWYVGALWRSGKEKETGVREGVERLN